MAVRTVPGCKRRPGDTHHGRVPAGARRLGEHGVAAGLHARAESGGGVWSQLKRTALVNLAARSLDDVHQAAKHGLKRLRYRPALLLGFLAETGLGWEELRPT
ncbi:MULTISPECIES: hypothetical protein [Frankia]|uniref:Transposase n=1 Tax=Frankia casuarinae (strain DSM 45818 / CECT 9043 / HFP020203 / CcI3) TaxID=106370 RepID=Q2JFY9_FRACC|nr:MULTISPECIES: hypothetical protein [Frankia]ABD09803.1 hypothetical protein Francci3_0416 [Frankia casuarinae]